MKKSKKRVFLYILIVLFTAAMVAEGALVLLGGNTASAGGFGAGSFQMPDGASMPQRGDIPSQTDETTAQDEDISSQTGETMPQTGDMSAQTGETMPQMGDMSSQTGEMPQGGGRMSQMNGAMSQSGDGTGETTADGQMGDMSNIPSFDGSTFPGGNRSTGILATARRYWIPIILFCLLGDIVCIVLLRRDKKAAQQAEEEAALAAADDDEPAHRKKKKWWIAPACIVLVITVVIASLPSGTTTTTQGDTVTVTEEIISGTAEAGTITTVLTGAGTISPETTQAVTIPSVVEVKTYHVQNGDQVYKGDVLASLDTTALSTAIIQLQEVLDELDDDLESERQTSVSTYVKAPTSGRVKAILAQVGDDAARVTAQEGALLLLSVDGLMKVEISADNLTVGQSLTVQLEDGTKLTGRVNSCRDGTAVVTVSDQYASYGGKVQVLSSDGTLLGEGTLAINSELKVTCTYGTISSVAVGLNQQVSQNTILFYLKDVGYSQDYQTLLARREELETQMQTLYALYPDGQVIAETDGIVSGIPDDAEYAALSSENETIVADSLTAQGSWQIVLLSSETETQVETVSETVTETAETTGSDATAEGSTETYTEGAQATTEGVPQTTVETTTAAIAEMTTNAIIETTETTTETTVQAVGEVSAQTTVETSGQTVTENADVVSTGETGGIVTVDTSGTVTENVDGAGTEDTSGVVTVSVSETETAFAARVVDFAMDDTGTVRVAVLLARWDNGEQFLFNGSLTDAYKNALTLNDLSVGDNLIVSADLTSAVRIPNREGESTESTTEPATKPATEPVTEPSTEPSSEPSAEPTADPSMQPTTEGGGETGEFPSASGDISGSIDISGFSGMSGGGSSSGTGQSTTTQKSYDSYSTATTTVMTLASQETMVIEIPVDELDVLSLTEGSEAQVTLDAVKGQTFTGTVNSISRSGTNSGGNTKYTVEVTLPGSDAMISGMNASVSVTTATTEAAITVPAAALYEEGGKTYVYTGYSEKDDTLLNPVEVETGVADEDTVEILSGLSAGDTYYYRYASGIIYTFAV